MQPSNTLTERKFRNGKGYKKIKKDVEVNIPAGINNGQQIRLAGKGERGYNGGENGDLYIAILVTESKTFQRKGNDIYISKDVDFVDCCLGEKITVPTVYGDTILEINSGTQPGQVYKLKGKGVKDIRGNGYGDEYVTINVKIPTYLNSKQKEALENYKKAKNSDSLKDKFKRAFK